jgi:hypothetical protein
VLHIMMKQISKRLNVERLFRDRIGYFIAVTIIVHLVSNAFACSTIAGPAFCLSIALMYSMIATSYSRLNGVISIVFGFLGFSFCAQLFGEVAGNWATNRIMMSCYLSIILVLIRIRTRTLITEVEIIFPIIASVFSSGLWLFISSLQSETLATFLGYGYDNVGWLMQGRIVLSSGGSVLLSGNSAIGPTFMQDSVQVGGSLIASAASLMGTTATDVAGLMSILTAISLAVPVFSVASIAAGFATHHHRRIELATVMATSIAIFGTGYLSRIWFSGYLGSNLGTMCAVLIVVYIATSASMNVASVSLLVVIMIHTYSLFALIGAFLLLVPVLSAAKSLLKSRPSTLEMFPRWTTVALGVLGSLLYLPYRATTRSYGASQFLTDGGIEYLPTTFFIILFVLFVVPLMLLYLSFARQKQLVLSTLLYVVAAFGTAAYSLGHVQKITYYPTKVIVVFMLMVVGSLVASLSQVAATAVRNTIFALVLCLAFAYVFVQPKSEVFKGAFMGETPKVLNSARSVKLEVVDSNSVIKLSEFSQVNSAPILYVSNAYESELNTRWINTLSLQWNDQSWSEWMQLRTLIVEEKFADLKMRKVGSGVMIVTDDENLFKQIRQNFWGTVCLRKLDLICSKP